jgi:hypothetical protein
MTKKGVTGLLITSTCSEAAGARSAGEQGLGTNGPTCIHQYRQRPEKGKPHQFVTEAPPPMRGWPRSRASRRVIGCGSPSNSTGFTACYSKG